MEAELATSTVVMAIAAYIVSICAANCAMVWLDCTKKKPWSRQSRRDIFIGSMIIGTVVGIIGTIMLLYRLIAG